MEKSRYFVVEVEQWENETDETFKRKLERGLSPKAYFEISEKKFYGYFKLKRKGK